MTEDQLQSKCYLWAHEYYPEHRGKLCYNLNNSRNRVRGMMDKAMGLQPGRSDMVLYHQGRAYMIELKLPGSVQSKSQIEWQRIITEAGFSYTIIRSFEKFQEYLHSILGK